MTPTIQINYNAEMKHHTGTASTIVLLAIVIVVGLLESVTKAIDIRIQPNVLFSCLVLLMKHEGKNDGAMNRASPQL